jgi:hypothetical protein
MPSRKVSFEKIELYLYRGLMLIVLILHFIKYLRFELSHW